MSSQRLSELHLLLQQEYKKPTPNNERLAEINYYMAQEFHQPSIVNAIATANWKLIITGILTAFIAANSQLHFVQQNAQDALLAVAVALGFWSVHSNQSIQLAKIKEFTQDFKLR